MSQEETTINTKPKGVSERFALLLTLVVNPLILPPISVLVTLDALGNPIRSTITAVVVTSICFALIPFLVMIAIVLRTNAVTIELRNRKYRTIPFLVSIAANIAAVLYFTGWVSEFRQLIVVLMIVYLINNVALLVINLRFKISLHMASIAGTVSILFFMIFGLKPIPMEQGYWLLGTAMICFILIPVLWWARQRLRAHTSNELGWGTLFGLSLPAFELFLLSPLFT